MNIFVTNSDYLLSACALDDKRVIKMILESTQMLCTATNEAGCETPYKSSHKNHPCSVWVRQNKSNFTWLLRHAFSLCSQYTFRYGKTHKCNSILLALEADHASEMMPSGELTEFVNCASNQNKGVCFKHVSSVTEAYKQYLNARWSADIRKPTWTNILPPHWANV